MMNKQNNQRELEMNMGTIKAILMCTLAILGILLIYFSGNKIGLIGGIFLMLWANNIHISITNNINKKVLTEIFNNVDQIEGK